MNMYLSPNNLVAVLKKYMYIENKFFKKFIVHHEWVGCIHHLLTAQILKFWSLIRPCYIHFLFHTGFYAELLFTAVTTKNFANLLYEDITS